MRSVLTAVFLPALVFTQPAQDAPVSARAKALHQRAIVIDAHDDTTQRLLSDRTFDTAKPQKNGNVDSPRTAGGGRRGEGMWHWGRAGDDGGPGAGPGAGAVEGRVGVRAGPQEIAGARETAVAAGADEVDGAVLGKLGQARGELSHGHEGGARDVAAHVLTGLAYVDDDCAVGVRRGEC